RVLPTNCDRTSASQRSQEIARRCVGALSPSRQKLGQCLVPSAWLVILPPRFCTFNFAGRLTVRLVVHIAPPNRPITCGNGQREKADETGSQISAVGWSPLSEFTGDNGGAQVPEKLA